jgi:hypothetical protein
MEFFPALSNVLWVRPEAYPIVEHLTGASLKEPLVIRANIRLGWKACQGQTLKLVMKTLKLK